MVVRTSGEGLLAFATRKRKEREAKAKKRREKRQAERRATDLLTKEERREAGTGSRVEKVITDSALSRDVAAKAEARGNTGTIFVREGRFYIREQSKPNMSYASSSDYPEGGMTIAASNDIPAPVQNQTIAPVEDVRQQSVARESDLVSPTSTSPRKESLIKPSSFIGPAVPQRLVFGLLGRAGKKAINYDESIESGIYTPAPFFSIEGQRQGIVRTVGVFDEFSSTGYGLFGSNDLTVIKGSGKGAYLLERSAENPLATAATATGVYRLGASLVGGGVSSSLGATSFKQALNPAKLTSLGISAAGTGFATSQAVRTTTLTSSEAELLRDRRINNAYTNTISEQQNLYSENKNPLGYLKSAGFAVSTLLPGTGGDFDRIATKNLQEQGVYSPEALRALQKERAAGGLGELNALLQTSGSSELIGRQSQKLLTFSFRNAPKNSFIAFNRQATKTGIAIAPAGAFEGATGTFITGQARGNTATPKEILIGGGAGAVSASSIGGAIGGFAATGGTRRKIALETFADITDPLEVPGDLLASSVERLSRGSKSRGFPTLTPSFGVTSQSSTQVKSKSNVLSTSTLNPSLTPTNIRTNARTNVRTNINSFVPTNTFTNVLTPTNIRTPVRTNTPVTTNTNILTNTQVPVQTNINTNVPVNTNVPTYTPILRLPALPITLGGGSSRKRKNRFTAGLGGDFGFIPSLGGTVFNVGTTKKQKIYTGLEFRKPTKSQRKRIGGLNAAVRL